MVIVGSRRDEEGLHLKFDSPITSLSILPFPFAMREIPLDKNLDKRRETVKKYNGQVVVLRDKMYPTGAFYIAQIRVNPDDLDGFYFSPIRDRGQPMKDEQRILYSNLQQLMETIDTSARDLQSAWIHASIQRHNIDHPDED